MPNEDCESFACNMIESLSSSSPRSGEVEEEDEMEPLDMRWRRRERDMFGRVFEVA